jgi:hypothetical protein
MPKPNHSLLYLRKPNGLGFFFEADLGSLPLIWLHPQVDPRLPIYRLVAIFENSVCFHDIFSRFYRYDLILLLSSC